MKWQTAPLYLYARTLSHLKARQIFYLLLHRAFGSRAVFWKRRGPVNRRAGISIQAPIAALSGGGEPYEFRFLNVSRRFEGAVDWTSANTSRLWRYNLHYFDYILESRRSPESVSHLIWEWIQSNPAGRGEGWEPYPLSLRVVNWIKLFLRTDFSRYVQPEWLDSLYDQTCWLERNIEYHLLANHLLKNGKALLFAGAFFSGGRADRWLRKGLRILAEQVREQILSDGGHIERSVMYHAIAVEDCLDSLNLISTSAPALTFDEVELLRSKACKALDFLHSIRRPDGCMPLFNDAAFGVAPSFGALAKYASRLISYEPPPEVPEGLRVLQYESSGYFVIQNGKRDMLIIDCGDLGPSYQLGHGHCDILSYELFSDGRPLIVDSGVYDYDNSDMRRYVRSTRAHNTAMIDGCEQSEIWHVFRVARLARPGKATVRKVDESNAWFWGSHNGFARLPGAPVHGRRIEYQVQEGWTIVDSFRGVGEHRVESFIHLHPDLTARQAGRSISLVETNGNVAAVIEVRSDVNMAMESGWYCPEFGKRVANTVILLSSSELLPFDLEYCVRKPRHAAAKTVDIPGSASAWC